MQLMNVALGEGAITFHKLKQAFQHIGMILNDGGDLLRRFLTRKSSNEIGIDAFLNQCFRDAAVEVVNAFDLAGFNCPFSAQTGAEFSQSAALLKVGTLVLPKSQQRTKLSIRERAPVFRQIGDWFPDEDHRVLFTRSAAKAGFFLSLRHD